MLFKPHDPIGLPQSECAVRCHGWNPDTHPALLDPWHRSASSGRSPARPAHPGCCAARAIEPVAHADRCCPHLRTGARRRYEDCSPSVSASWVSSSTVCRRTGSSDCSRKLPPDHDWPSWPLRAMRAGFACPGSGLRPGPWKYLRAAHPRSAWDAPRSERS